MTSLGFDTVYTAPCSDSDGTPAPPARAERISRHSTASVGQQPRHSCPAPVAFRTLAGDFAPERIASRISVSRITRHEQTITVLGG